ncbi:MAG: DeoR/GlpR transcriptional regulator [Lentisphaerae bacterium]|nr:DeoR/GlpR transcriptional regulator [Lentisphaerota bacterium]
MSDDDRELAVERLERVRAAVREARAIRVAELCRRLGVSAATMRRDLEALEARGELRRVHGGAVSVESRLEEPLFDDKAGMASREKSRVAGAAARRAGQGATVYLDGGSTVLELARELRPRTDLTVVTNSLRAATELSGQGPRTILVGGELRRLSQTLVGTLTRHVLETLQFDVAFMGTMGLGLDGSITTTDPAEAYTKELVMGRAAEVVLLADRSKLGKVSFARAGRLDQVDVLVTDRGVGRDWRKVLKAAGVALVEA